MLFSYGALAQIAETAPPPYTSLVAKDRDAYEKQVTGLQLLIQCSNLSTTADVQQTTNYWPLSQALLAIEENHMLETVGKEILANTSGDFQQAGKNYTKSGQAIMRSYAMNDVDICGEIYKNAKCIWIHEIFTLRAHWSRNDFNYDNMYGYIYDNNNNYIARILYIKGNSKFLMSQHKLLDRNVNANSNNINKLVASPNPASTMVTVSVSITADTKANLTIIDNKGKIVAAILNNQELKKGEYNYQHSLNGVMPGIYRINLQTTQGNTSIQLIINQ
jgi:hypothetical protein